MGFKSSQSSVADIEKVTSEHFNGCKTYLNSRDSFMSFRSTDTISLAWSKQNQKLCP